MPISLFLSLLLYEKGPFRSQGTAGPWSSNFALWKVRRELERLGGVDL